MRMVRRVTALLLAALLCLSGFAAAEEAEGPLTVEQQLKSMESWTKSVTVLGHEYLLFAQNSPEWAKMYTSKLDDLIFGDSACMVTSLSNVLANTVPYPDLGRILEVTKNPIRIDLRTCASGRRSVEEAQRFEIQEECDFLRYLPLCIDNYASGNNIHHISHPRLMGFFLKLLDFYGLKYEQTKDLDKSIEALTSGENVMLLVSSGGQGSAMTVNGHFYVAVGYEDGYMYFLDSYFRDKYNQDTRHIIEILEPGLIRVKKENLSRLPLMIKYIIWADEFAYPYTQDRWEEIKYLSDHPRVYDDD